jgi:uncharacterized protein (TIGR00251 family)
MALPSLRDGSVSFMVRLRPGAHTSAVLGVLDDGTVHIAIAAEPQENAANLALIRFLSKHYGVPQASVSIVKGLKSKLKTVRIN